MDNLPTEIVAEVASHLPFPDKINLECVCKKLKAVLETTLYNTLVFKENIKLVQAMVLLGEKGVSQQVRQLSWNGGLRFTSHVKASTGVFTPSIVGNQRL